MESGYYRFRLRSGHMTIIQVDDDYITAIGTEEVFSHHDLSGMGCIEGSMIEMPADTVDYTEVGGDSFDFWRLGR